MSETIAAYPLQWPDGWRRMSYDQQTRGRFNKKTTRRSDYSNTTYRVGESLSVSQATRRLLETFERMKITDFVISTDIPIRLDGLPRSGARMPDDTGVAVYWIDRKTEARRCMAIDRYDRVADNIAAIWATLEAMRSIERHGGAEILNRAFTGFIALPSPEQWWQVLGFENTDVSEDDVNAAYRKLAQRYHPDRGGSEGDATQQMARINVARDAAKAHITGEQNSD